MIATTHTSEVEATDRFIQVMQVRAIFCGIVEY